MSTYLKDIKIHIDNRIINTNAQGKAIINKVPKGIQYFSIVKDGYLPIESQINVPNELEKNYNVVVVNNSYQITVNPSTAIINVKRTTISGEVLQMQYIGQTPQISGSFGDKVEYTIENENYDSIEGTFYLNNPAQNGQNAKSFNMSLSKGTLNLYVTDVDGNGIKGATVQINNQTYTTSVGGLLTLENLYYGKYPFTVSGEGIITGSSNANINKSVNNVYYTANEIGRAFATDNSIVVGDNVILNSGMATSDLKWSAYPVTETSMINDLSLEGSVVEISNNIITLENNPQNNAEIEVKCEQDNAEIEFNNLNEVCEVEIDVNAVTSSNMLAFIRDDNSVIYFKDRTYPFVPSDNNFNEVTFTYYTYEDNVMVEHTATTQSSSSGNSTYDGTTLTIHSQTVVVDGIWTRDSQLDMNYQTEYDGATITTSTTLNNKEAIINLGTNHTFAIEKSNDWDLMTVIGGSFADLPNLRQIIVPDNTIVDIYATKKGQTPALFKSTYSTRLNITSDRIYRKVNFVLQVTNEGGANITLTVNGISFTNTGSQQKLDVYAGQTVTWKAEKEGFTTQTGIYTVPDYPMIKEQIQSVTLVSA